MRIAVAGAGLSGLAVCHAIQERLDSAGKSAEMFLFEAEDRAGGKIHTHRENGYVMEWGPNGFLNNKPDTLELCRKLGIDGSLLPSNDAARRRFVYAGGALREITPVELAMGGIMSWSTRFRILQEYFIPKRTDGVDETLGEFARRRLGPQMLERLIGPMAQGVFGGDPEKMSLRSCFPVIYNLEQTYGGLIKGMLGKRAEKKKSAGSGPKAGPAGPGGVLTSFEGGLEVLTDALQKAFRGKVFLGKPVTNVTPRDGGGFTVYGADDPLDVDIFVTASPAYAAKEFLAGVDTGISNVLGEIGYVPMAVIAMGYERQTVKHDLNGFGFLVGLNEGTKVIGTLWDSSVFKGRAPEGKCSLRSMIGGGRDIVSPSLPDAELSTAVLNDLRRIMNIDATPELTKIFRHEKAIPSYTVGHSERLLKLDGMERKYPGLFFGGNAFRGVGLNDCVRDAYAVADKVAKVF